jgi:hypothetical protein
MKNKQLDDKVKDLENKLAQANNNYSPGRP